MRVRPKLIVIILFAAVVPLVISALTIIRRHRDAYARATEELYRLGAVAAAAAAESYLAGAERTLAMLNGTIQWPELSTDERGGALLLVYKQLDDIIVTALLDEAGEGLGPAVYRDGARQGELAAHPEATLDVLRAFAANLPFAQLGPGARTVAGAPFSAPGMSVPIVPILVPVEGQRPNRPWAVAVGLAMRSICADVARGSGDDRDAYMLDAQGRVLCGGHRLPAGTGAEMELADARARGGRGLVEFRTADGIPMLASVISMPRGWSMVVEQNAATVRAPVRAMLWQTLFWAVLSLAVALLAGAWLARRITRPLEQLSATARELGRGNFARRAQVAGRDELSELAQVFNQMGDEVQKREDQIRAWNEELAGRVDERTRELKDAQAQLIQSQKIAAVSVLGAGIAHEINNPLTGVVGLAQVLLLRARQRSEAVAEVEMLTSIEAQALRIRRIVQTLLSFTQNYAGEGFAPIKLHNMIDHTLELVQARFAEAKVELASEYTAGSPEILGNRAQLEQAVLHLLNNSLKATPAGGCVTVATSIIDGELVRLSVIDNGKGIAPENLEKIFDPFFTTKDDWRGEGLGLTVAYRIVEEHHGSIKATSQLGRGTTVSITLPRARGGAHLV